MRKININRQAGLYIEIQGIENFMVSIVIGLIAVAVLSLLVVLVKYRNKVSRGEWLIAGLAIGILSTIIGFYMGTITSLFLFLPNFLRDPVFRILLLFIVSSIVYTYLKKESAVYFIKLLFFSFIVVLFSAFALFLTLQSDTGLIVMVEKISIESQINGMNDYVKLNITEKELDEYPALKKAIIDCRDFNNCSSKPNAEEWMSARGFLDKKAHESGYLFSVMDERSEGDLNKGIFPPALRNAFESRGLPLSDNAFIEQASYQEVIRWNIYTEEKLTYEIWKENGKLNIYHAKLYAPYLLKIAGNYYRISERWED